MGCIFTNRVTRCWYLRRATDSSHRRCKLTENIGVTVGHRRIFLAPLEHDIVGDLRLRRRRVGRWAGDFVEDGGGDDRNYLRLD